MTYAQRARLVVALGVLNVVLATVALAVGITAPPRVPDDGIAVVSPPPIETTLPSPNPTGPTGTVGPRPSPAPSAPVEPSPSAVPSVEPSATPLPSGAVAIVDRPTSPPDVEPTQEPATPEPSVAAPTPTPAPTVAPSPVVNPTPTAKPPTPTAKPPKPTPTAKPPKSTPTAKPPATPKPQPGKSGDRPPCPGDVDGPPGHNKDGDADRPCGKGGGPNGGMVLVLPFAIGAIGRVVTRRTGWSLRPRRRAR